MIHLLINIKGLAGIHEGLKPLRGEDFGNLNTIENAFLMVHDGIIEDYGPMEELSSRFETLPPYALDCSGKYVLPAWCDSHTHLVFSGSREREFVDKIRGASYADIAARGGGILYTARSVKEATEEQLFREAWERMEKVMKTGTGSLEIKSGYGLSLESELKMLRVIRMLKEKSPMLIKSTFLGAHSYPPEYRNDHEGYLKLIEEQMLPAIEKEKLVDYIDVFCEDGFFSKHETIRLCRAGIKHGLKPKIHANQLNRSGGVQAGIEVDAISVDHLESMGPEEIDMLADSQTIGTLLPTAAFFLRMNYPPAREMIEAGCALAIASDYNPGSSPGGNMEFVISLSCIQMKMLPEEALNAATFNGACAMEVQSETGSIHKGKRADLLLTKEISSLYQLPYAFSESSLERMMLAGQWQ